MWYDSYVFNDMVSGIFAGAKWLDSDLVSAWIDDVAGKKPDITTVKVFEKITIEYRVSYSSVCSQLCDDLREPVKPILAINVLIMLTLP